MTPFIDKTGVSWALELFKNTNAKERILILRDMKTINETGDLGKALLSCVTNCIKYNLSHQSSGIPYKETFHSKIVLADGAAAYVGSANMIAYSREVTLECGFLIEGPAVHPVSDLIDAVIQMNADMSPK